ncbi:translation initiation factor 2 subunit beta [Striga asiatica]|uniref:Translation initiation factor 2 subunit beta n=1 Tax=Striga asiatica TaxID=4170 RepID=A0A5A7PDJ8_STRAF|nr:translation initiation factor 2 subunit beta [Striga asiatica]
MSPPLNNFPSNKKDTPYSTPTFRFPAASPRRTASFSSESSFDSLFSSNDDESYPPYNPGTPLKLKGIPFSWERIPGIPKSRQPKNDKFNKYSGHLLPPPPAGKSFCRPADGSFRRDPFFTALVECSKDDDGRGANFGNFSSKITRTLSDRFGLVGKYASCKSTCTVSDSIMCQSRPGPHYLVYRL